MSKKLILAIALSLVLVSGGFLAAHAQCCLSWLNPCNWHLSSCGCSTAAAETPPPAETATTQSSGCWSWLSPCNWHLSSLFCCGCSSSSTAGTTADADRPDTAK